VRRLALVALLGAALVAAGCGADPEARENADTNNGRELFVQGPGGGKPPCGSCHTLADAATVSTVGPNLDDAFAQARRDGFDDSTVYEIVYDQIDLAAPPMPADIVTGQDAIDVAAYVASVAGKPVRQPQGGAGTGTTTTAP
jgi:mono/diheme cytochrome c family protein